MPDGSAPIRLAPRRDSAARHVELLTGSADTPCCFRLLGGMGDRNLSGRLANLWEQIEAAQEHGSQVFVIVNEGGHDARSITYVRALFVDSDGAPIPAVWHAEPDFIVRRDAGHWHAYWLVAALPLAEFKAAQKRLAARYGTDPKVCDLPRIMRLAGTLHLKDPNRPLLVRIEGDSGARFPEIARSAAELMAELPEIAATKRPTGAVPTGEPVSLDIIRDMLGYLDSGCDRNQWRDVIAAIRAAPVADDDDESGRRQLAHQWSEPAHNYTGTDDVDRVFDDMEPPEPGDHLKIHFGSLVTRARAAGYTGPISIKEAEAHARFLQIAGEHAERTAEAAFWERLIEASGGAIRRMSPPDDRPPSPAFVERMKQIVADERRRGEEIARKWGLR